MPLRTPSQRRCDADRIRHRFELVRKWAAVHGGSASEVPRRDNLDAQLLGEGQQLATLPPSAHGHGEHHGLRMLRSQPGRVRLDLAP
jgi:hypothetical protein